MKEDGPAERAEALVHALLGRSWGHFDFMALDSLCQLTGWDRATTAAAIRDAAQRGWLRSFGFEAEPLGCRLTDAGARIGGREASQRYAQAVAGLTTY